MRAPIESIGTDLFESLGEHSRFGEFERHHVGPHEDSLQAKHTSTSCASANSTAATAAMGRAPGTPAQKASGATGSSIGTGTTGQTPGRSKKSEGLTNPNQQRYREQDDVAVRAVNAQQPLDQVQAARAREPFPVMTRMHRSVQRAHSETGSGKSCGSAVGKRESEETRCPHGNTRAAGTSRDDRQGSRQNLTHQKLGFQPPRPCVSRITKKTTNRWCEYQNYRNKPRPQ